MGIFHFVGLGRSPGAVTSGLAYLYKQYGESTEFGKTIEGVVVFTSKEIFSGDEKSRPVIDNIYGSRHEVRGVEISNNSFEIVEKFICRNFQDVELWVCLTDVMNFSVAMETIAKTLIKFHPPGKVGRHIWANITGGTNILNSALINIAFLSGYIPVLYYTFVSKSEDNRYLKPFSSDEKEFDFRKIYVIKTNFDRVFQSILEALNEKEKIKTYELYSLLKNKYYEIFKNIDITQLQRDYLNTMVGVHYHKDTDTVKINEDGKRMLEILRKPWMRALLDIKRLNQAEIDKLTMGIDLKRIF